MRDVDNPRLQCEKCGKWRRLITKGEQCMFYWAPEHDDFVGDTVYQNICVWCVDEIKAAFKVQETPND
jgi:hypothetical protein